MFAWTRITGLAGPMPFLSLTIGERQHGTADMVLGQTSLVGEIGAESMEAVMGVEKNRPGQAVAVRQLDDARDRYGMRSVTHLFPSTSGTMRSRRACSPRQSAWRRGKTVSLLHCGHDEHRGSQGGNPERVANLQPRERKGKHGDGAQPRQPRGVEIAEGLFPEEEDLVSRFIKAGDAVLVIGAGSGRDVIPLATWWRSCWTGRPSPSGGVT